MRNGKRETPVKGHLIINRQKKNVSASAVHGLTWPEIPGLGILNSQAEPKLRTGFGLAEAATLTKG